MPTVRSLLIASSLGFIALDSSIAIERVEKLALSATEVNLLEVPLAASAQADLFVAVYSGSASDPQGREGLAWVTAELIARQAGDGIRVTVTRDMTLYTIARPEGKDSAARALTRAILKPVFDAGALDQVKKDALAAIESIRHDPAMLAVEALFVFIHRGHPYGHPSVGTESGIGTISLDDALAFHAGNYLKGNLAIAVPAAGVKGQTITAMRSDIDAIPNGGPTREEHAVAYLPRPEFLVVESTDAPSAGMILAGHPSSVTVAHPDFVSLRAALTGVVESNGRILPSPARQPLVILSTGDLSGGPLPALAALLDRIRGIGSAEIPAERLSSIRDAMRRGSENPAAGSQSPLVARLEEFLDRSPGIAARREAMIDQITSESIRSAAARHLFGGRVAIVAVVPSSERFVGELLGSSEMNQTGVTLVGSGPTRNDITVVRGVDLFR